MATTGWTKRIVKEGNGREFPEKGNTVTMEYTGNLYDANNASNDFRGAQFDSSVGRGDFKTAIGVGKVIKGWDEGVPTMSLGEKAILTIPSDLAYGESGFYDLIPPNSTLVFEVELKGIEK